LIQCATLRLVGTSSRVEVVTGVVVSGAGLKHVPNRHEHGVFDGDDGFDRLSPGSKAAVLGRVVGVVRPRRRRRVIEVMSR